MGSSDLASMIFAPAAVGDFGAQESRVWTDCRVRMNPEVDKNKKEESWRKRRPGIYVVIIVKIYWASRNILDKNLSFRLTMQTLAH